MPLAVRMIAYPGFDSESPMAIFGVPFLVCWIAEASE